MQGEAVTGIMDENNVTDVYDGSDDIERISFNGVKYNRKMNRPDGAGGVMDGAGECAA